MSDHPLNEYKELFVQLKIKQYKEFILHESNEGLVAGTIMSIQEKKSSKGTPFAIVKFSDNTSEFELFIFSDLLTANREKLIESSALVLTQHKERAFGENAQRRVNIRNILDLREMIDRSYDKVSIELDSSYDMQELKETLKEEGKTEISLIIIDQNKRLAFKLEKSRKFNLSIFNAIKN